MQGVVGNPTPSNRPVLFMMPQKFPNLSFLLLLHIYIFTYQVHMGFALGGIMTIFVGPLGTTLS